MYRVKMSYKMINSKFEGKTDLNTMIRLCLDDYDKQRNTAASVEFLIYT